MPKLLLKFHAAVIKEIPIEKTPLTIGRKPDNDIVIDNMSVSSHHAKITLQGTSYVIEDLQSTNGTFINEKRIVSSALRHEDGVLIGQHTIVFIDPGAKAPAEQKAQNAPAMDSEATIVMTPSKPQAAAAVPTGPVGGPKQEVTGVLRVIEGKLDQSEYSLSALLTYIGKSDTAAIKIKGLFAPDIAALVSKRPSGYLVTAVKDGYPKLNGKSLSGQLDLNDGDIIELAGIKLLFQLKIK
ncbi:MAG TPA: hypothetical protein DEE98_04005 [Elusimicrobia bacterium]|nr:MAG: hypothetical protein A2278_07015 [Elusimicrobia bacterium RIFOXYA12_FULL_49_49]OGS16211.1 MAG: hypothetical protein A2251_01170 [Elusimicrobia bacterium RIFOXYA2_FULL_47_53]OGS26589.1 MAG: hypothetical protein A2339_04190 [Elusimicrobia bacterium RIFOXYB12_FULL_50_12]OGS31366.1 MAG: hypothetical protein A2323_09460 [Elusimicrobia bacterium RIFOXYB2_FULL_46_23]HBU69530.1 hypothetical protein [Elusimicrobiota bacterium]